MATAARFMNATVTATSPKLTIKLDGDTVSIPARNYGLTLTVGKRVRVELVPPPTAPMVSAVLT